MFTRLQQHLSENFPYLTNKKLLLAVSGGLDSMVLADIFRRAGYQTGIAHCNFRLRGGESDADQQHVHAFADKYGITFHHTTFDTAAFASDYNLSVQVAARELRYNWFGEIRSRHDYDYILTAHHADDSLETFLINLTRGTGIDGLTGIPPTNGHVIRPLLAFSREDILLYANENGLTWREDSSNESDKYTRNKIRHKVVPLLKELNPSLLTSFAGTVAHLQQTKAMADDAAVLIYQQVVEDTGIGKKFDIEKLLQLPNANAYLYTWLSPFGFRAWDDIYALLQAQPGKQVFAENFRLLKDRAHLILSPVRQSESNDLYDIPDGVQFVNVPVKLSFTTASSSHNSTNKIIFVDRQTLQFPLKVRRWQDGDSFIPFGMKGRSKKVSKLLKDVKLSLWEKEEVWLLLSGDEIVWVIGVRQDERFRTTETTTNILQISLLQ